MSTTSSTSSAPGAPEDTTTTPSSVTAAAELASASSAGPPSSTPSVRVSMLTSSEDKARKRLIRQLQAKFSSTFCSSLPSAVSRDSRFLAQLHDRLLQNIDSQLASTFDEWKKELKLEQKLGELDRLVDEAEDKAEDKAEDDPAAKRRKKAWRPSGQGPSADLAAHHVDLVNQADRQVEADVLEGLTQEVTDLYREVDSLQKNIEEGEAEIEAVIREAGF